jgi:hypothetical protein
MGFFKKTKRLVYDKLLVLPAGAKCPKAFKYDIDLDVTSHSKDPLGKQFSPFVLGEVQVENGLWAYTLESAWQYSKVFPEHLDAEGNPSDEWFEWRESGLANQNPVHFPMGRGAKHEYFYVDGEKFDAVEARDKLFVPWYLDLAKETEAWHWLESEYRAGKRILMRDFRSIDNIDQRLTFDDCLNDPHVRLCHGYIIARELQANNS